MQEVYSQLQSDLKKLDTESLAYFKSQFDTIDEAEKMAEVMLEGDFEDFETAFGRLQKTEQGMFVDKLFVMDVVILPECD